MNRRSRPLQETAVAQAPKAWISAQLAEQLGIAAGNQVKFTQGQGSATLAVGIDAKLPANVVRVAAAQTATAGLGAMFGAISVEKV